jgi:hypothetical protein
VKKRQTHGASTNQKNEKEKEEAKDKMIKLHKTQRSGNTLGLPDDGFHARQNGRPRARGKISTRSTPGAGTFNGRKK